MEDWVTIRNLKKHNPKLGIRAIAKLLGVSRNTVKRALKGFRGSSSSVYRYINENFSEQREDLSRRTYLRFETEPAEQMQYDWAEYKVNAVDSFVISFLKIKTFLRLVSFDLNRIN